MNKKFMVVALMAALSTVGYAFEYTGPGAVQEGTDKGNSAVTSVEGLNSNFNQVKNELNNKVSYGELAAVEADKNAIRNEVAAVDGKVNGLNDKLDAVEADKNAIRNEVAAVDGKVNGLHDKLDAVEADKDAIRNEVAAVDGKVNGLHDKLDAVEADKDAIRNEMETADKNLQNQINGKADKDYVDGKVTELGDHVREEMDTVRGEIGGVKAEVYENKEAIAANKAQIDKNTSAIENHEGRLDTLENKFAGYDGRLSGLEKKVDHLDDKMNKGLSLMAAMNAVDFQNVQTGEMALGAGIGHYGNAQSVALGVAYAPVEDLTVNAKYSITAGDPDSFAVGAGATYKFKVGR